MGEEFAESQRSVPYVWGRLSEPFECSGFIASVLRECEDEG